MTGIEPTTFTCKANIFPLNYIPLVSLVGLEPTTNPLWVDYSNQLNYKLFLITRTFTGNKAKQASCCLFKEKPLHSKIIDPLFIL